MKINIDELLSNMMEQNHNVEKIRGMEEINIPPEVMKEIDKSARKHTDNIVNGRFDVNELMADAKRFYDMNHSEATMKPPKLDLEGLRDGLIEMINDYEDEEELCNEGVSGNKEYNVDVIIKDLDLFRRKYYTKFKDADTFWEMFFEEIREIL